MAEMVVQGTYAEDVRKWYDAESRWNTQHKSDGWVDRILVDFGAMLSDRDVLNVGCFWPEDELAYAPYARTWQAIDFAPGVIERCKAMRSWPASVTFQMADMRALPFPHNAFDVVTDNSSGDHLSRADWLKTLDEVFRVLRRGGYFSVVYTNLLEMVKIDPRFESQPWRLGDYGYERADSPADMRTMLEQTGFRVLREVHTEHLRTGMLAMKPFGAR